MKGKTLAQNARRRGWNAKVETVSSDGRYNVHIYRGHWTDHQTDIHLTCDKTGEIVKAERTVRTSTDSGYLPDAWVSDLHQTGQAERFMRSEDAQKATAAGLLAE